MVARHGFQCWRQWGLVARTRTRLCLTPQFHIVWLWLSSRASVSHCGHRLAHLVRLAAPGTSCVDPAMSIESWPHPGRTWTTYLCVRWNDAGSVETMVQCASQNNQRGLTGATAANGGRGALRHEPRANEPKCGWLIARLIRSRRQQGQSEWHCPHVGHVVARGGSLWASGLGATVGWGQEAKVTLIQVARDLARAHQDKVSCGQPGATLRAIVECCQRPPRCLFRRRQRRLGAPRLLCTRGRVLQ